MRVFEDRSDAGRRLAERLMELKGQPDVVVLGVPRGGVPVAREVARVLGMPLDVFLCRKLGVPGQAELAFGAVTADGGVYPDEGTMRVTGVNAELARRMEISAREDLAEQARRYRRERGALELAGRTVVVVDDGIATGASMVAAVRALRGCGVARVIVAAPVAPREVVTRLELDADRVVVVWAPEEFYAVGQFYREFRQVAEEEVVLGLGGHGS